MKELRIVSLVPSLSELVCDFGLEDSIVGCTNFCISPKSLCKKAKIVGGTKDPDLGFIAQLKPTHVLVNEEENRLEDALKLKEFASVIETFPRSPADVPDMVLELGTELGAATRGQALADEIVKAIDDLNKLSSKTVRFAYFIWNRPWMVAAQDTYISRFLELSGFTNVVVGEERYPQVELSELEKMGPEIIFFSSEPWPFRKRDGLQLRDEWPAHPPIHHIDGKLASWYGSSTIEALHQLKKHLLGGENKLIKPMEF